MGRPTKFDPSFVERAKGFAEAGATDLEIATALGIGVRTLYEWKNEFPQFSQAIKIGKEPADRRVERALYDKATGYAYTEQQAIKVKLPGGGEEVKVVEVERFMPPDTTSMIFWLKNRRAADWRDVQDHRHQVTKTYDFSGIGDSDLADLERIIAAARPAGGDSTGTGEAPLSH